MLRSLRSRLALLVAAGLLAATLGFGALAAFLFVQQQRSQLEEVLERELDRIRMLVAGSEVGTRFAADAPGDLELQFVSEDGQVRIPADAAEPLPLVVEPTLDRSGSSPRLIGSTSWLLPSGTEVGTIRIALDLSEAYASRRALVRSLLVAGVVALVLFVLVSLEVLRRMLSPLRRLEAEALAVDPAAPRPFEHVGPRDEIDRVAAALNKALEGIREHQDRERDMLSEVSHELGGPLSVVVGQLEGLAIEMEDDPRVTAAHEAATELLHTSRDLITLARGELEIDPMLARTDVGDLAQRLQREYPAIHLVAEHVEVMGDARRLRQALRNLVRNGVEVGGAEGVRLAVNGRDATVVIEVSDAGPSLGAEEIEHIFDPHFRLRRGAVSGIGLAVAKRIVEQHGGTIGAEPRRQRGMRYTVTLPTADAPADAPASALR